MHNQHRWTACNFLLPLMLRPLTPDKHANRPSTFIRERGVLWNLPQGICIAIAAFRVLSEFSFAQTTRTNASAASTTPTIQSSTSTSPNTPCSSFNPTSPCYSGRIPRSPCYSAAAPDKPCSTTTTPNTQLSTTPLPSASKAPPQAVRDAQTRDQAKAQIEMKGYSKVSGLWRDREGVWR